MKKLKSDKRKVKVYKPYSEAREMYERDTGYRAVELVQVKTWTTETVEGCGTRFKSHYEERFTDEFVKWLCNRVAMYEGMPTDSYINQ